MQQSHHLQNAIAAQTWSRFSKSYYIKYKKDYKNQVYTVTSSVGFIERESQQWKIISVGFGTKSLPQSVVTSENKGDLMIDMHAEMLAIRGFRRWLLRLFCEEKGGKYFLWNQKKSKYMFNKQTYEIFLYSSEVFCGDCFINQQKEQFSGAKPLKYINCNQYQNDKFQPNILRTKPGRLDLPLEKRSKLLSCSDKIAWYNIVGLQGIQLFSLTIPLYFDRIILHGAQGHLDTIKKGVNFIQRIQLLRKINSDLILRKIFNVVISGKQRALSHQFKANQPKIIFLLKIEEGSKSKEGFQLCGIFSQGIDQWLNGRTGLPEGSSLKNYRTKGKISNFSDSKLQHDFPAYARSPDCFKFQAITARLKKLLGQWIDFY